MRNIPESNQPDVTEPHRVTVASGVKAHSYVWLGPSYFTKHLRKPPITEASAAKQTYPK